MVNVTPKPVLNIKIFKASLNKWMTLEEFQNLKEENNGDCVHDSRQKPNG